MDYRRNDARSDDQMPVLVLCVSLPLSHLLSHSLPLSIHHLCRFGDYGNRDGGGYVPPKPDGDNNGCPVEVCKYDMDQYTPVSYGSLSDFSPDSGVTQLDYPFGTVWNDCNYNGPVR